MKPTTHPKCSRWGIWSYSLPLRKPLAVLGEEAYTRRGWIVGRKNIRTNLWEYGEVAPLPTFHLLTFKTVYDDLIQVLDHDQSADTALVQNVLDIWELQASSGTIKVNDLLGSTGSVRETSRILKIKLGRQSLKDEMTRFQHLQNLYPNIQWRLDCNQQWSLQDLRTFWSICNPKSIDYIEDPLKNPREMIECPNIPFALDESLTDLHELLHLKNVITMVIKPSLHNHWKTLIKDHPDKRIIISSTFEGSLGLWGLGQLALHYAPSEIHGLGTLSWFKEECVTPPLSDHDENMVIIPLNPPSPRWENLTFEGGR